MNNITTFNQFGIDQQMKFQSIVNIDNESSILNFRNVHAIL